jgi:hypothetical protein
MWKPPFEGAILSREKGDGISQNNVILHGNLSNSLPREHFIDELFKQLLPPRSILTSFPSFFCIRCSERRNEWVSAARAVSATYFQTVFLISALKKKRDFSAASHVGTTLLRTVPAATEAIARIYNPPPTH